MVDLIIHPTAKFVKAGAILAGLIFLALEVMCLRSWNDAVGSPLIMLAPLLVLAPAASRAVRRRFTKAIKGHQTGAIPWRPVDA